MENGLTDIMIERQDFVDCEIFEIIRKLNPSAKEIQWDIEKMGKVRDTIKTVLVDDLKCCSEFDFYPYLDC